VVYVPAASGDLTWSSRQDELLFVEVRPEAMPGDGFDVEIHEIAHMFQGHADMLANRAFATAFFLEGGADTAMG